MEWTIIEVLVVIVGLFLSVGAPILKQSGKIQQIIDQIGFQQKELNEGWKEIDQHGKQLQDHETRITILEHDNEENSQ